MCVLLDALVIFVSPTFYCCMQISNYEKEVEEMKHMTRQEYIAYLRR
jgi:hypothetical protein